MTLPELCIRRPVMTILLVLALVIAGLFSYRNLPVAALPRVDLPTLQVSAGLPGASPETMASSVATVLERQFSTIAGIDSITSSSTRGSTQITLQFTLDRDIDGAALDVQSAISSAVRSLPQDMPAPPTYRKVNPADQPVLLLALTSDSLPLSKVTDYAETLFSQNLSTISGVAQINIFGSQKYAIRIKADPRSLAGIGLGFMELGSQIAAANSNAPLGNLSGSTKSVSIEANGQLASASEYRTLVIGYRNGNPIRLGDIAQVADSVENEKSAGWFQGERAIILAIQRQPDANTVDVVNRVKQALPFLQGQLPPSIDIDVISDRSLSILESIHDVQITLGLALVFVVATIFVFLRSASATLIPAIVIPVSLVGTFVGMYLLDYSIDNLSLLAMTLAIGFVVDDAIVMVENIVRHVEQGEKPFSAALKGAREITFTIISITLSLVAVFIPVLFMGGVIGRFFREFGVTISLTILISGLVSLTLTPMMCSLLLRSSRVGQTNGKPHGGKAFNWILHQYRHSLAFAVKHKFMTLMITLATLILTIVLYGVVPKGLFPVEDNSFIFASTEGPQDIAFAAMSERQQKLVEMMRADPAIETVGSSVGSAVGGRENQGRMFLRLKPASERDNITKVIQRLRQKSTKVADINAFFQPVQNLQIGGRQSKSLYQFTLQAADNDTLVKAAQNVEKNMSELPGLRDITSDLMIDNPELMVDIDHDRAMAMQVTNDAIRRTLYAAYGARQISTIYRPTNDYQVILEAGGSEGGSLSELKNLFLAGDSGKMVPLAAVADFRTEVGPVSINHQGQLPSVTLSFNLAPGVSLGDAVAQINEAVRQLALPAQVVTKFQGTAGLFTDTLVNMALLVLASILAMYIILGVLYESFIHPVTILSGLPSAGIGALLALLLFKVDLNVISIIGIVLLIGIVKKNAIMMVDVAISRRAMLEESAQDAILHAAAIRFRPIMMTTMAAIAGGLPVALGIGAGAELRQPLGIAIVGGLILSQVLTLYITPVVYLYLDKLRPGKAVVAANEHG